MFDFDKVEDMTEVQIEQMVNALTGDDLLISVNRGRNLLLENPELGTQKFLRANILLVRAMRVQRETKTRTSSAGKKAAPAKAVLENLDDLLL